MSESVSAEISKTPSQEKPKLPVWAMPLCFWPLVLVLIGGAIGGGLGGLAAGINMKLFHSRLPVLVKIVLNLLAGGTAITLWFLIALKFNAMNPR